MKPALGCALLVAVGLARVVQADDAAQFNDFLKYTQEVIAKQHLIVYAKIEFDNSKKKDIEFRYDHYPEVERMQLPDGATYARKTGKAWVKSDDWGETGKPAGKAAADFDNWIDLANVPIQNIHEERDKSQGGVVPTILPDEGDQEIHEIVIELRREHSTNFGYPRFGFVPFGDKAIIHTFNGGMHYGPDHVTAHFRYDFLFKVNITEATPTPAAGAATATSSAAPSATPVVTKMEAATTPGAEELLKAACKKMERGSWKVEATISYKKSIGIKGLINGQDFDLTTKPEEGKGMRQITIATLSWLTADGGKSWKKTDASDRSMFNWVHSTLIGNKDMPAFESVGTEKHEGETWQHLRLKVPEKVEASSLPQYWIAVNDKGEALFIRRFEGPVIIQGNVMRAKEEYAPSKEPFISPPMMH